MSDDLQPIPLPNSLQKLKTLCIDESVYAMADGDNGTMYGRMVVRDGRIWIYSFQSERTDATVIIEFKDLIVRYNEATGLGWPKTAFIQLSPMCSSDIFDGEDGKINELKNIGGNVNEADTKNGIRTVSKRFVSLRKIMSTFLSPICSSDADDVEDEKPDVREIVQGEYNAVEEESGTKNVEENDLEEPNEKEPRNLSEVNLVIETNGQTDRTRDFLLICTALKGNSYIGCKIRYYPEFHEMELGPPPEADQVDQNFIWGIDEPDTWLLIKNTGRPSVLYKKEGEIVAGFQDMANQISCYTVSNCGIVI